VVQDAAVLEPAAEQLRQYFAGQRQGFDLPLAWDTFSEFQAQVLRLVAAVPYGQLTTYAELAKQVGGLEKARAVGRANATNPLPIVIPCHRVLGADGKLHGYAGGLETKAALLRLEGSWLL
jgi:methylated-DNA-[protein]-cysteine S-methyltransferase